MQWTFVQSTEAIRERVLKCAWGNKKEISFKQT